MSARRGLRKGSVNKDVNSPASSTKSARSRKILRSQDISSFNLSSAIEVQTTPPKTLKNTTKKIAFHTKFLPKIEDVAEANKTKKLFPQKFLQQEENLVITPSKIEVEADKYFDFKSDDSDTSIWVIPSWRTDDIPDKNRTTHQQNEGEIGNSVKDRKQKSRKMRVGCNSNDYSGQKENEASHDHVGEDVIETQKKIEDVAESRNPRKMLRAKRHFQLKFPQKASHKSETFQNQPVKISAKLEKREADKYFDAESNNLQVVPSITVESDHDATFDGNCGIHYEDEEKKVPKCIKKIKIKKFLNKLKMKIETPEKYFSCNEDLCSDGNLEQKNTNNFQSVKINQEIGMKANPIIGQEEEITKIKKTPERRIGEATDEYFDCNLGGVSSRKERSKISMAFLSVGDEDIANENDSVHQMEEKPFPVDLQTFKDSQENVSHTQTFSPVITESNGESCVINKKIEETGGVKFLVKPFKKRSFSARDLENCEISLYPLGISISDGDSEKNQQKISGCNSIVHDVTSKRNTQELCKFDASKTEEPIELSIVVDREDKFISRASRLLNETFTYEITAENKSSTSKWEESLELISPSTSNSQALNHQDGSNCKTNKLEGLINDFEELNVGILTPKTRSWTKFEENVIRQLSPSTGKHGNENIATPTRIANRRISELEEIVTETSLPKSKKKSIVSSVERTSSLKPLNLSNVTFRRKFNTDPGYSPIKVSSERFRLNICQNDDVKNLKNSYVSPKPKNSDNRTSTPKIATKPVSLLKKSSEKFSNSRLSRSAPSLSKKSKVKIPNFSLIHQKTFEKMESVLDHKQRKEERAKFLLSGQNSSGTINNETDTIKRMDNSTKSIRKQLRFASDVRDVDKPPNFVPLPSTPLPRRQIRLNQQTPEEGIEELGTPKKTPVGNKLKTPKKLVTNKENVEETSTGVLQHNLVKVTKVFRPKDGFTRFGFKMCPAVKKEDAKEALKIIANKTAPVKNTTDKVRKGLKKVRSNRRFDLLMQMRNK